MEWSGACSLYWRSLTAGAATWSSLYCLYKGCAHQNDQIPKNAGLCALVAYIAGDTLHHQPMGVGHMTVLQFTWAYGVPLSCNGVIQCWPGRRGQAIVPGSSPYMVRGKWIQARALITLCLIETKLKQSVQYCGLISFSSTIISGKLLNLLFSSQKVNFLKGQHKASK